MPALTQMLVDASGLILHHAPYVLASVFLIGVILWRIHKTSWGKYLFDKAGLRLPVFGDLFQKAAIAGLPRLLEPF